MLLKMSVAILAQEALWLCSSFFVVPVLIPFSVIMAKLNGDPLSDEDDYFLVREREKQKKESDWQIKVWSRLAIVETKTKGLDAWLWNIYYDKFGPRIHELEHKMKQLLEKIEAKTEAKIDAKVESLKIEYNANIEALKKDLRSEFECKRMSEREAEIVILLKVIVGLLILMLAVLMGKAH